jgi:hypothetical protein
MANGKDGEQRAEKNGEWRIANGERWDPGRGGFSTRPAATWRGARRRFQTRAYVLGHPRMRCWTPISVGEQGSVRNRELRMANSVRLWTPTQRCESRIANSGNREGRSAAAAFHRSAGHIYRQPTTARTRNRKGIPPGRPTLPVPPTQSPSGRGTPSPKGTSLPGSTRMKEEKPRKPKASKNPVTLFTEVRRLPHLLVHPEPREAPSTFVLSERTDRPPNADHVEPAP